MIQQYGFVAPITNINANDLNPTLDLLTEGDAVLLINPGSHARVY